MNSCRRKFYLKSVLLIFVVLFLILSLPALPNQFSRHNIFADDQTITSDDITISATIGESTAMTIFGYAPVSSTVSLFAHGIFEERATTANGYFSFDKIYTTEGTDEYPELCLIAYIGKYSTQPTCLPPLPGGNRIYNIGPVILSPIISIEQNVFTLGTQVTLNGTTIPNSLVKIYLAETEHSASLIPAALAYFIPTYEVTSDNLGKFQFNLPSNTNAKWKVYASTAYGTLASPKSNTLNFTVESKFHYFTVKIYETIVKTVNIITTAIKTTKTSETMISPEEYPNNVSVYEIESFRRRVPYFVIFIEVLVIILLIVFVLVRRARKNKKKAAN